MRECPGGCLMRTRTLHWWPGRGVVAVMGCTLMGTLAAARALDSPPVQQVPVIKGALTGVAALSGDNAWAVGLTYTRSNNKTLIMHWDGTAWKQVRSPSPGTDDALYGVAAVSARQAWAVGNYFAGKVYKNLILHWHGTWCQAVPFQCKIRFL